MQHNVFNTARYTSEIRHAPSFDRTHVTSSGKHFKQTNAQTKRLEGGSWWSIYFSPNYFHYWLHYSSLLLFFLEDSLHTMETGHTKCSRSRGWSILIAIILVCQTLIRWSIGDWVAWLICTSVAVDPLCTKKRSLWLICGHFYFDLAFSFSLFMLFLSLFFFWFYIVITNL